MREFRLETERLILRPWRDEDRVSFHALGNDPDTMRYLGPLRSQAEDDAAFDRQRAFFDTHRTCGWAVERQADSLLIGICGIKPARPGLPIAGEMEIGWRFGPEYRRHGYAFEAARASLHHAWSTLFIDHVVAITVRSNTASWRLMEKLGMRYDANGDFDHPFVAQGSPLMRTILYRIDRPAHV